MPYKDPAKNAECKRRWRLQNPEKMQAARRSWLDRNKDRALESVQRWKAANPERVKSARAAAEAKRRAKGAASGKNSAQPCPIVRAIYRVAQAWRSAGFDVHVDHIVPLCVEGEHVWQNLTIIPARDNLRKRRSTYGN